MRKYQDEQYGSTMFTGEKAQAIIGLRQSMDDEAERICQELHSYIEAAGRKFDDLGKRYESQFAEQIKGTDLEGTPLSEIGFDFSKADQHGIVFARQQRSPIAQFIEMLRRSVEQGPIPTDSIYVEPKDSVSQQWDQRRQYEPA